MLLPFFRIVSLLHFSPLLDNRAIPARIKVAIALVIAGVIVPALPTQTVPDAFSIRTLLLVIEQLIWGFLFGTALQLVFVALQTAGHILSMNMGLGMAVMNDPVSGNSTTVVAQIIYTFCGLLFFIMDGHLVIISILYKGFTWWPIGEAISQPTLKLVVGSLGWMIATATMIALPTTFVMLIVQIGFGLLNRISPTLNLFSLGFPISMLFGLFCISLLVSGLPENYLSLTNTILTKLEMLRSH